MSYTHAHADTLQHSNTRTHACWQARVLFSYVHRRGVCLASDILRQTLIRYANNISGPPQLWIAKHGENVGRANPGKIFCVWHLALPLNLQQCSEAIWKWFSIHSPVFTCIQEWQKDGRCVDLQLCGHSHSFPDILAEPSKYFTLCNVLYATTTLANYKFFKIWPS